MDDVIIELLPSQSLKNKIRKENYRFSEIDLLNIIYGYAPTFDRRTELLHDFSGTASPEIAQCAREYAEWQQRVFKCFCEESDGCIYELHMKVTPDECDERSICASYEAALNRIDWFFDEYHTKETEKSGYKIVKRRIYTGNAGQAFDNDRAGECLLGPNKVVLSVDDDRQPSPYADCNGICMDCSRICPHCYDEILFPCFTHDRDIVKYTDYEGREHFGVCFQKDEEPTDSIYIIPLDSDPIRYHAFDKDFYSHEHILPPFVTLADWHELSEQMQKDYTAYMAYLDSMEN
ncbi:MAG: hypothetical protein ACI3YK_04075 [Eubacteriales bacterium]